MPLIRANALSLAAVKAVLEGKQFVSASLAVHDLADRAYDESDNRPQRRVGAEFVAQKKIRHEVEF